jgi:homoserine O-succinyltransferase
MNQNRVAILDMYRGHDNQGMRCIGELLASAGLEPDIYEVRQNSEIPSVCDYSIFISTGGPGDPHEVSSHDWGKDWQNFINEIRVRNSVPSEQKRYLFMICHSFQMACISWNLATVTHRKKPAFGIYPINKTEAGSEHWMLEDLYDPFWIIDSREWQVVEPIHGEIEKFGAQVLAIEQSRPHVPLERATMAIAFSPEIVGTQFHPEADESGMQAYLDDPEKLENLAGKHGADRIQKIQGSLGDPQKVNRTHSRILPNFLKKATQ